MKEYKADLKRILELKKKDHIDKLQKCQKKYGLQLMQSLYEKKTTKRKHTKNC